MKTSAKMLSFLMTLCAANAFGHTLSLNVGAGIPISNVDVSNVCSGGVCGGKEKAGSTGLSIGGQYLYNLREDIGIGVDVNYFGSGDKTSSTFIPRGESTLSSKMTTVLAVYKYTFTTKGAVWPYVIAGLGFGSSNLKVDAKPAAGFVWADTGTAETRSMMDSTKTVFASAIGLGMDIPINQRIALGGEVRWVGCGSANYDSTQAAKSGFGVNGVDGSLNQVLVTAKVGYKF